jgi:hypothetical protein
MTLKLRWNFDLPRVYGTVLYIDGYQGGIWILVACIRLSIELIIISLGLRISRPFMTAEFEWRINDNRIRLGLQL